MTTINVNAIESSTSTLTIGASGNSVVAADSVNVNLVKDASGATMWQSNGSGVLSNVNVGFGGALVLLSTTTVSSAVASINFTSNITSTYGEYIFKFYTINPATDGAEFTFNGSSDSGSNYNVTKTTTFFFAEHSESGSGGALAYQTARDLAQSTGYQDLGVDLGNGADESCAGELHLFNPSSTTYVKNFYSRIQEYHQNNLSGDCWISGYFNTTSAINAISFKMSSGNINAGKIKMYGVL